MQPGSVLWGTELWADPWLTPGVFPFGPAWVRGLHTGGVPNTFLAMLRPHLPFVSLQELWTPSP